ncbi:F-box protein [Panicum miliaceum]|uniref:F-box protein n=1 Tax=Panicum miliaceum TaxID=4540 RepID=A0A3L6QDU4_PANMI|nr:F-box protein [Panicum miliaceum]
MEHRAFCLGFSGAANLTAFCRRRCCSQLPDLGSPRAWARSWNLCWTLYSVGNARAPRTVATRRRRSRPDSEAEEAEGAARGRGKGAELLVPLPRACGGGGKTEDEAKDWPDMWRFADKPLPPPPLRARFVATEPAPPPEKTLAPPQGRRVAGIQAVDAPREAPAPPARPAVQDDSSASTAAPTGAASPPAARHQSGARPLSASRFLRDEVPDLGLTAAVASIPSLRRISGPRPAEAESGGLMAVPGGCLTSQEHQLHRYTDLGPHFMHLQILCIVATSPCSTATATVPLQLPQCHCHCQDGGVADTGLIIPDSVLVASDWSDWSSWVAGEVLMHRVCGPPVLSDA